LKHSVKVAYWDTEAHGQTPPLLGQVKGTPTLKAFVPDRKSAKNQKRAVDYEQAREVRDMGRFALSLLPNYVEAVGGDAALGALLAKGREWGLPVVLLFSETSSTSSLLKALSAEYRRRLLLGELKAVATGGVVANAAAIERYGVTSYPTLIALKDGEEVARFHKRKVSHFALDLFFGKIALRKPVTQKPMAAAKEENARGKEEL